MIDSESLLDGYRFYTNNAASFLGGYQTDLTNGEYLRDISTKIQWLKDSINSHGNYNPSNNGYLAEYWHEGTYNISAAVMRTNTWAHAEDSPAARGVLGGADITTSWDEDYGLKYCKDGKSSAMAQAKTIKQRYFEYRSKHPDCSIEEYLKEHGLDEHTDINLPLYESQARLIPADQLIQAREALQKRIDHDLAVGGEQAKDVPALIETRDALTDHIEGPNGEKSFQLTQHQSKQLQHCAKNGTFDPAQYDITAARLADKAFILSNAVKAGATAAWTSALLKMVPEIISVLKRAVEEEKISIDDLRGIGSSGIDGAAMGFIRGTLMASITTSAEMGYLGESLRVASLEPSFASSVAVIVTTAMSIAHDSIDLAKGRISKEEYTYRVEKTVFIASAGYICGVTVQGLFLEAPAIGYMLGSFIGSVLGGAVFEAKERVFISICVERGWSFFGLVTQDYELPEDIARQLGYDNLTYSDIEHEEIEYDDVQYDDLEHDDLDYDDLEIITMRRGVIGVRKVGYLPN